MGFHGDNGIDHQPSTKKQIDNGQRLRHTTHRHQNARHGTYRQNARNAQQQDTKLFGVHSMFVGLNHQGIFKTHISFRCSQQAFPGLCSWKSWNKLVWRFEFRIWWPMISMDWFKGTSTESGASINNHIFQSEEPCGSIAFHNRIADHRFYNVTNSP